tara:strand:- start:1924 stop:3078 length:1155 start_codon:yes stop_codon:yes gene_type:complete
VTIGTANVQAHPKSCICCKAFPFALKLSNAVKMARTSTAKAGVAAEEAKAALLVEPEDKCVARWAELEDSGLNQEVAKYRKTVIAREKDLENVEPTNFEYEEEVEVEVEANGAPDGEAAAVVNGEVQEEGKVEGEGKDGEDDGLIEGNVDDIPESEWMVPPQCIPIHANVVTYDWSKLYENTDFDVIMMDPPWQLATANPTRGVSLGYSQLTDHSIADLPIPKLQKNGFIFVWVINAKYQWTLEQFKKWGYEFVDEIVWVKVTNSRRLAKSHGFYLQHAKEVCLVGRRGEKPPGMSDKAVGSDIIFAPRRGQSQKPTEIYELIEEMVPGGKYLEIFARKNNLRDYWVSVGNEVTGTGLPPEDVAAFEEDGAVPGAKYGAHNTKV